MRKNKVVFLGGIVILIISLFATWQLWKGSDDDRGKMLAVVYMTPTCGCCYNYVSYLESRGFKVRKVVKGSLDNLKKGFGIPKNLYACHTVAVGDYFVEGHIPVEAISDLLEKKPQIKGIALPGMPSGSPGMPGFKTQPFKIFAVKDNSSYELFGSY